MRSMHGVLSWACVENCSSRNKSPCTAAITAPIQQQALMLLRGICLQILAMALG